MGSRKAAGRVAGPFLAVLLLVVLVAWPPREGGRRAEEGRAGMKFDVERPSPSATRLPDRAPREVESAMARLRGTGTKGWDVWGWREGEEWCPPLSL